MTYLTNYNWMKKPYLDSKENHPPTTPSHFSRTANNILKIRNSILITIIFVAFAQVCWGQDKFGDYRSLGDGLWTDYKIWQIVKGDGQWTNAIRGQTPTSTSYVTIKNNITVFGSPQISGMTIDAGSSLIFGYLYTLIVSGDLTINGMVNVAAGSTLKVTGNTFLGAWQCLLIDSNDIYSGSVISKTFSGTGSAKLKRFMSYSDNWHLYSSPFSNQTKHNFIQKNPEIPDLYNTGKVAMREYNTTDNIWNDYITYSSSSESIPFGTMGAGIGYSIRTINDSNNDSTGVVYATGMPNNSESIALNTTGLNRWNCIGNPFTSGLQVSSFLSTNWELLEDGPYKGLYIWDSANNLYIAYNLASPNGNIQLGQGFFVKSKILGGNIVFNPDMQVFNYSSAFKGAEIEWPSIKIVATLKTLKSSTLFKLVTNTTIGLDPGYDAGMFSSNSDFELYSRLIEDIGVDFCLQSLPDQNSDQYVIPIGIDFKAGGDITFTAETVNLPVGCLAVLEDRLTKQFTRLDLKDAKYVATVSANTKGTGRFFLHTSDVISGNQPVEKEQFKVSTIGTTVYINGEVSDKANFFVYSVNGKQLANFKAESQVQNQFDATGFPAGVYILTIDDKSQKKSTKFVIEN